MPLVEAPATAQNHPAAKLELGRGALDAALCKRIGQHDVVASDVQNTSGDVARCSITRAGEVRRRKDALRRWSGRAHESQSAALSASELTALPSEVVPASGRPVAASSLAPESTGAVAVPVSPASPGLVLGGGVGAAGGESPKSPRR